MKKILISYPIPRECIEKYQKEFDVTLPDHPLSYDEISAVIGDYDAYFAVGKKVNKEILDKGIKLKAVANFGVGYDNIDWKYATEKKIAVVNTPTQVTDATAEHTVALILSVMRSVARYDREIRKGVWYASLFTDRNTELTGRTLGIIGFGRIGKAVAKKAQGLGMNVIYYNRTRCAETVEKGLGVTYMEFEDVLKNSDCISLHMPYLPENHHLFNMEVFKKMKPDAYLINCARGPIVDEKDLAEALRKGVIKGAGLDVFEEEPKVPEELKELENVTLTPHVASATLKARMGMAEEALSGIAGVLKGEKPVNVINQEVL